MGSDPIFCVSVSAAARHARFGEMARLPRLCVPGVPNHVMVRGNDRQPIFTCEGDRLAFIGWLREEARKNELAIHAYVLMTNHVHLLMTPSSAKGMATAIQAVGRKYVPRFNRLRKRTGTLWEGRYRSTLVESVRYAMTCQRYIELNPVRAGMVPEPAEHIWSSYLHYAHGKPDDLLTPHIHYLCLGEDGWQRQRSYRQMFAQPLEAETLELIRTACHHGWALGSDEFCLQMESMTGRRARPRRKGRTAR